MRLNEEVVKMWLLMRKNNFSSDNIDIRDMTRAKQRKRLSK